VSGARGRLAASGEMLANTYLPRAASG
jgi:hypothetical protein